MTVSCLRADVIYSGTESVGHDVDRIDSAGAVIVFAKLPPGSFFAEGLAFNASGDLFTADDNADQISKITPAGVVSLFATLPNVVRDTKVAAAVKGQAGRRRTATHEINKIAPNGTLSHFATLSAGSDSTGLAFDSSGNLFAADGNTDQISKITPAGTVNLFATLPASSVPLGLAFDANGNLYAADLNTDQISRISSGGAVSLFAMLPAASQPIGLAFDGSGNLYVGGVSGTINKITSSGMVSLLASGTDAFTYLAVTDDAGHPRPLPPFTVPESSSFVLVVLAFAGLSAWSWRQNMFRVARCWT